VYQTGTLPASVKQPGPPATSASAPAPQQARYLGSCFPSVLRVLGTQYYLVTSYTRAVLRSRHLKSKICIDPRRWSLYQAGDAWT